MSTNKQRVLEYIDSHDEYNHVRDMAIILKLSPTTIYKWLNVLIDEKAVRRINLGKYGKRYVFVSKKKFDR